MTTKKMLLVGKRHASNEASSSGGIIVPFEQLIDAFESHGFNVDVIDTNFRNYNGKLFALLSVYFLAFKKVRNCDAVLLFGSNPTIWQFAGLIGWCARRSHKPFMIRFLGGNLNTYITNLRWPLRGHSVKNVKIADKVFIETKHSLRDLSGITAKVSWFPNVRPKTSRATSGEFRRKFVFLGHVKREKGIDLLLQAIKEINQPPGEFEFSIFGPLVNYFPPSGFEELFQRIHHGPLEPNCIAETLSQHDVLLFPSIYKNEGHPGVIIEALNVGLPIVASDIGGISEMIDDDCGILIEPGSVPDLTRAVLSFNDKTFSMKSKAAIKRFEQFDSELVVGRILKEVESILK